MTQKRIFCGAAPYHSLSDADRYGGLAGENFDANTFVGRCIAQDDLYYYYISWRDGRQYAAEKKYFVAI